MLLVATLLFSVESKYTMKVLFAATTTVTTTTTAITTTLTIKPTII